MRQKLLEVQNLKTQFSTSKGNLTAVNDVSFHVDQGETLCIVGESGCGKSMTLMSIMRLLAENGFISNGSINFQGQDLKILSEEQMRRVRGDDISMIFQEPLTALNPVFTIGYQLKEAILNHRSISNKAAYAQSIELLQQVGIPAPKERMAQHPHELSGGMRQRIMIAMALACEPKLLLADEPTTALDVTIQAQILELIDDLKDKFNMGVLLITHDMGVVAEIADRVIVMYAGEVVESGEVKDVFNDPKHPYTQGLLQSVPRVDDPEWELEAIPGTLPSLDSPISGCKFNPRCKYAMDICTAKSPKAFSISPDHKAACWLYDEENVKVGVHND